MCGRDVWIGLVGIWLASCAGPSAGAAEIRLKDGTKFAGTIVRKDPDSVLVRLDRAAVTAVDGQPMTPPLVAGAQAPDFKAVDLNGATQALADNHGQVTLLQFWASWCPHCRRDVSLMKDLFAQYQNKGLKIVTVSIDRDRSALKTFIQSEQLPYSVIHADDQSLLPDLYEAQGVPTYVLIDGKGAVMKTRSGSLTEMANEFKAALDELFPAPVTPAPQSDAGDSAS